MKKKQKNQKNKGMTYAELIVVLSIFSIVTSIALFDYNSFEQKTNLKILAGEIAIEITEAQKNALLGAYPESGTVAEGWKPSYGMYFLLDAPGNDKSFVYYADLNQSGDYADPSFCVAPGSGAECQDKISITNNNRIAEIKLYYQDAGIPATLARELLINFTRPDSRAFLYSPQRVSDIAYAEIIVSDQKNNRNIVKIYPSGRIETQ